MHPTDAISWGAELALADTESIVNAFAQGRYISVDIRSEDTQAWTVTGIDLEAEMRGYF
jgi:hypothetical protein